MSGLETSFYIVGLIFMSVLLVLIAFMVAALIVIRNKVVALEKTVHEKLHSAAKLPNMMVEIANAVREVAKATK